MPPVQLPPDTVESGTPKENLTLTCPRCGQAYRPSELTCTHCGAIFSPGGNTQLINGVDTHDEQYKKQTIGDVYDGAEQTIICRLAGKNLTVNVGDGVVLGRCTGIEGDPAPDVDLTPYGAGEKGVSRRHVRIQHKNHLLYVSDLGSSNGTWLNGRHLITNGGRPLRDGDELRLAGLVIQISF